MQMMGHVRLSWVKLVVIFFVCVVAYIRCSPVLQHPSTHIPTTHESMSKDRSHLSLSFCHGKDVLERIRNSDRSQLREVDLSYCELSSSEQSQLFRALCSLQGLEHLSLTGIPLTASTLRSVVQCIRKHSASLRHMSFSNCELDDTSATVLRYALRHASELQSLDLSRNAMSGEGIRSLLGFSANSSCRTLQELDLSYNNLGPAGYKILSDSILANKFPQLQRLHLRKTGGSALSVIKLIDAVAKKLPEMIEHLDLAGNINYEKQLPKPASSLSSTLTQSLSSLSSLQDSAQQLTMQFGKQVWKAMETSTASKHKSMPRRMRSHNKPGPAIPESARSQRNQQTNKPKQPGAASKSRKQAVSIATRRNLSATGIKGADISLRGLEKLLLDSVPQTSVLTTESQRPARCVLKNLKYLSLTYCGLPAGYLKACTPHPGCTLDLSGNAPIVQQSDPEADPDEASA